MYVLSISSLKGGVGKTTVTLGLASAALARSLKTLVVDLDPQADATMGLGVVRGDHATVADALTDPSSKTVQKAITASSWVSSQRGSVLDVLIGSPALINLDSQHPTESEIWRLEQVISTVENQYDLVLIDCPPSLNALTRTGWVASDRVALVTEPGLFSIAACDRGLRVIEEVRLSLAPRLRPLGIIVNRARVQSLEHQFRIKELREMFGQLLLSPRLPERTSLQQTQGAAMPIHVWPGETAEEMAKNFDLLLDKAMAELTVITKTRRSNVRG